MQNYRIGSKVKESLAKDIAAKIESLLPKDEKIRGIYSANNMRPLLDGIVITEKRFLGVSKSPSRISLVQEISGDDIESSAFGESKLRMPFLKIQTKNGKVWKYNIRKEDSDEIVKLLASVSGSPIPLPTDGNWLTLQDAFRDLKETAKEAKADRAHAESMKPENNGKCPRCGSDNLQVVQESKTKGVSTVNSTAGCCVLGPLGLLCGLPGAGRSSTKTMRMCMNCGNKF